MKTEYTNQLQREASGHEHEPANNYFFQTICDKHDFIDVEYTRSGTNEKGFTTQCKNCGYFVPAKPTPSSTVDLEREAEELYPNNCMGPTGTMIARNAYIKGRQTSQKGLEELIEWLKYCQENGWIKLKVTELLTKATELLNKH